MKKNDLHPTSKELHNRTVTVNKYVELIKVFSPILDYLEESERKHYAECSKAERRSHVYRYVLRAKKIISETKIKSIINQ